MNNRYQYYKTSKNAIICVSHYAGKSVKGVAKCSPNDEFNEEIGKELAKLRCDAKVASLRRQRAADLWWKAEAAYLKAEAERDKYGDYLADAEDAEAEALDELNDFLADMGV